MTVQMRKARPFTKFETEIMVSMAHFPTRDIVKALSKAGSNRPIDSVRGWLARNGYSAVSIKENPPLFTLEEQDEAFCAALRLHHPEMETGPACPSAVNSVPRRYAPQPMRFGSGWQIEVGGE